MGKEERAEMYFELEAVNKELKELKWKFSQMRNFIYELHQYLTAESFNQALSLLEKPANKPMLNLEAAAELFRKILSLEAKKADLEAKLGSKVTLE